MWVFAKGSFLYIFFTANETTIFYSYLHNPSYSKPKNLLVLIRISDEQN